MMNIRTAVILIGLSFSLCSCYVPYRTESDVKVVARLLDTNSKEISRIEEKDRHTDRQYLFSPEGPVKFTNSSSQTYLVDRHGIHKIKEFSYPPPDSSQGYQRYYNYFPILNSSHWVVLSFFQSEYGKEHVDIALVEFGKEGVVKRSVISDCKIEQNPNSSTGRGVCWTFNDYVLFFKTQGGLIIYDLRQGRFPESFQGSKPANISSVPVNKGPGGVSTETTEYYLPVNARER